MPLPGVGWCGACGALVNPNWKACQACGVSLAVQRWLPAWRELASIMNDIPKDDPRHLGVLAALDRCDTTFLAGDWTGFERAAREVHRLVEQEPA